LFTLLAVAHVLGLFSVGLLMGEGRLQCLLLGAVTLLLARTTLSTVLRARSAAAQYMSRRSTADEQPQHRAAFKPGTAACGADLDACLPHCQDKAAGVGASPAVLGTAYWVNVRPAVAVVSASATMLACNVGLQALGLIDRAGKDPHDKSQPTDDLFVGPDAIWQRAGYMLVIVGPLPLLWMMANWFAVWLQHKAPAAVQLQRQSSVLLLLLSFGKAIARLQFVLLSIFWQVQLAGVGEMSMHSAWRAAWELSAQMGSLHVWLAAGHMHSFKTLILHTAGSWVGWTVWKMPFRLLLPQMVYAAALLEIFIVSSAVCAKMVMYKWADSHNKHGAVVPGADLSLACQLWLWLCVALTAPYIMVLGYKGPVLVLLAVIQAGCVCVLIWMHDAAAAVACQASSNCLSPTAVVAETPYVCHCPHSSSVGSAQHPVVQEQHSCRPSAGHSMTAVVGAGCWSMMSMQLFFCSGHFCEFSGLQYASAFIGFDRMVWYTSGSLLLLNTCGSLLLGSVTLPLLGMAVQLNQCGCKEGMLHSRALSMQGKSTRSHAMQLPGLPYHHISCGMQVMNLMRFAALVVCMLSAALQQQHILLWAIFAPKLVFELWFMAVVDVFQLFTGVLIKPLLSQPFLL
jgi:phosphatidylinositol glycan class O